MIIAVVYTTSAAVKLRTEKINLGLNEIRTDDLCDTVAVLNKLKSIEPSSQLEAGHVEQFGYLPEF